MVKVKLFLKSNTIPLTLSFGLFFLTFLGTIVFELWKNGFIINSDPSIINEIDISQKPVPWNEIFIHNFVILTPILLGILNLGLLSFFYLILQGYLLGVSIGAMMYEFPFLFILKYTLPHGIFEVLAICFLGAFAFKPGIDLLNKVIFNKKVGIKNTLKHLLILFIVYLFLLFLSAVIEGFITPNL